MMGVLFIGPAECAAIAELKAIAAAGPLDPPRALLVAKRDMRAWRDYMKTLSVEIPFGYHVTFTHERQRLGLCAHLSASAGRPARLPSPAAIEELLSAFDMQSLAESTMVWIEEVDDACKAVNVLQVLEKRR